MMALFPMPVTISLPLVLYIACVVAIKSSFINSDSFAMDSLSDKIVFLAVANMFFVVIKTELSLNLYVKKKVVSLCGANLNKIPLTKNEFKRN